jgi:hypothetical protein
MQLAVCKKKKLAGSVNADPLARRIHLTSFRFGSGILILDPEFSKFPAPWRHFLIF